MMGGEIWVESELGQGSTFHFTVRMRAQTGVSAHGAVVGPIELREMRVLVVDDNVTSQGILEQLLTSWQMRPSVVGSGEFALSAMRAARDSDDPFLLVLLDADMPGMDGFTLAERIRQAPDLSTVTIMMLTSTTYHVDAARSRELGISAYLVKPIAQSNLFDAIVRLFGPPSAEHLKARVSVLSSPETRPVLRILLAEDNETNQQLAVRLLEKHGHEVKVAGSGTEAVAAFEKESFDLILMDLHMPQMGGLEATAFIREKERATNSRIPIIALTARALKGQREKCIEAGMDGYVSKPIDVGEFFNCIYSLARSHEPAAKDQGPDAGPQALNGNTVLDREALLESVEGDLEFLHNLVKRFLDYSPNLLLRIDEAYSERDGRTLEDAAHTLKGAVGSFRAARSFEAASRLEKIASEGNFPEVPEAIAKLKQELERLKPELNGLLLEYAN
jgi:CheY-like chemotaxis protein